MGWEDPDSAGGFNSHTSNPPNKEIGPADPNTIIDGRVSEEIGKNAEIEDTTTNDPSIKRGRRRLLIDQLLWAPSWCRWDKENPPKFGLPLNILFAFAGTFTVWKNSRNPRWEELRRKFAHAILC